jgi:hypothetical protein
MWCIDHFASTAVYIIIDNELVTRFFKFAVGFVYVICMNENLKFYLQGKRIFVFL